MLEAGQNAPEFSLPDSDMKMVNLKDFRGKNNIVLYFYPKDDTTGCTIEAVELSDLMDEFHDLDALVFGVSRDNCVSHAAFRDKHGLTVQLLADTEGEMSQAYGVLRDWKLTQIAARQSFIVAPDGTIARHYEKVDPDTHTQEVLADLEALMQSG